MVEALVVNVCRFCPRLRYQASIDATKLPAAGANLAKRGVKRSADTYRCSLDRLKTRMPYCHGSQPFLDTPMRKLASSLSLSLMLLAGHAAADGINSAAADPVGARISANSLRGHLSFIASDLLEGRGTPSRGADIAAEYIAAQFRRAGLEPVGDDGYFQTAHWDFAKRANDGLRLVLTIGGKATTIDGANAGAVFTSAMTLGATPVVSMTWEDALADTGKSTGKVLVVPAPRKPDPAGILNKEMKARPALIVLLDERRMHARQPEGWLIDPQAPVSAGAVPAVLLHAPEAIKALTPGSIKGSATLAATVGAANVSKVKLRNVVGVLRGSDPVLKNEYVMLSAHYDHVGVRNGDIYNGANDDGSGTVSVIEIAQALSAQPVAPKRSIMFVALFGEELGMLGSKYYARNPLVPLKDTVAQINLEQVGRTDDSEGPRVNSASLTGFDFSTLGETLRRAGERTGIEVWKHASHSDAFFSRGDNQSLADVGIPAHSLCTAFMFPDYHGKDDTWDKIDYDNMARVNRMVAAALQDVANTAERPRWTNVPGAAQYKAAAGKLR